MAKIKKKAERGAKSFTPKVTNRNKLARNIRSASNISARQIIGTACHKTELLCNNLELNKALKYSAIMANGSHSDFMRRRAAESLRELQLSVTK